MNIRNWLPLLFLIGTLNLSAQKTHPIDSIKYLLKNETTDFNRAKQLIGLAEAYRTIDLDSAVKFGEEAYQKSIKGVYREQIIESGILLSKLYKEKGDLDRALEKGLSTKKLAEEDKDTLGMARVYNSIAGIYFQFALYPEAVTYCLNAIALLENTEEKKLLAANYNTIGDVYRIQNQYNQALEYYNKSYPIFKSIGHVEGERGALSNIALVYSALDRDPEAIVIFNGLIADVKKNGPEKLLGKLYNNLANAWLGYKQIDSAIYYNFKAVEIRKKYKDWMGLVFTFNGLGDAYADSKQHKKALLYFDTVLQLTIKLQMPERKRNVLEDIATSYEELGDWENAYINLREHKSLQDSIFKVQKLSEIARLEVGYEIEKRDRENEFLKTQNELSQQKLQYQATLTVAAVVVLVLVLLAGLFWYRASVVRQKSLRLVTEKNNQLRNLNEEIRAMNEEIVMQNEKMNIQQEMLLMVNNSLLDKNEQLRDLNNEINSLIGIVAHDLNSPLNKVQGLSTLVRLSGELNEEQQQYLQMVNQETDKGKSLIKDLLLVNSIEQSGTGIRMENVELMEFFSNLVKGFSVQADKKNISLVLENLETGLQLTTDRDYLSRILDNLVSNGLKFSRPFKSIYISAQKVGSYIKISVKDEGPGINEEDQKRMFKKFQKLSAQPTAGEASTGLGLAIVKTLTEKLGARIELESTLGVGTTFHLMFKAN